MPIYQRNPYYAKPWYYQDINPALLPQDLRCSTFQNCERCDDDNRRLLGGIFYVRNGSPMQSGTLLLGVIRDRLSQELPRRTEDVPRIGMVRSGSRYLSACATNPCGRIAPAAMEDEDQGN